MAFFLLKNDADLGRPALKVADGGGLNTLAALDEENSLF